MESNPPSSDPSSICSQVLASVNKADKHCPFFSKNKMGILKGAEARHNDGTISEEEKLEIIDIVKSATVIQMRPLVYVIPMTNHLEHRIVWEPAEARANPLSKEFIIPDLKTEEFSTMIMK